MTVARFFVHRLFIFWREDWKWNVFDSRLGLGGPLDKTESPGRLHVPMKARAVLAESFCFCRGPCFFVVGVCQSITRQGRNNSTNRERKRSKKEEQNVRNKIHREL